MRIKLSGAWKKNKRLFIVNGIIVICTAAIFFLGYRLHWKTGFADKTLWDWLQLLIIPAVLALGGYLFTFISGRNEHEIALDNQREAALQAYIDKVSELLLQGGLGKSPPPHEVAIIARARTATVLRILDPVRRGSIIQFLSQSGILSICVENSIKGSFDSPLNNENSLAGSNLQETNLNGANLSMLNLEKVNLQKSIIKKANLQGTDLSGANLQSADLSHTNLQEANLCGANLQGARLYGADLRGAKLIGTILERANLWDAVITQEQWEKAKSLQGATMPDGSKHP